MNTGFAQNVRMLLADRSRLAANAARRLGGNRTELTRGVYSPCDLCKENPSAPPALAVQGARDRPRPGAEADRVSRRGAGARRLAGVLHALHFRPGPVGKARQRFSDAGSRQFEHTTASACHDPVFSGRSTGQGLDPGAALLRRKAGSLLAAEYRQRFGNGTLDAIGSLNYSNVGSATDTSSERTNGAATSTRRGVWHLNETYRTGFDLQRVSDQTYLLRFGFGNAAAQRDDQPRLSQGFEPRAMTDVNRVCVSAAAAGARQLDAADRAAGR